MNCPPIAGSGANSRRIFGRRKSGFAERNALFPAGRKARARRRAQARRVGAIHRKVRERRKDLIHQLSDRTTAKFGTIKIETLNVKGMARNRHLALSVADAGMSRLVTFLAYKAD
jgi:transposase